MKYKRLFPLLISACLFLSSCSPNNTMLKTADIGRKQIDYISYSSELGSVTLMEEEQAFMLHILEKASVVLDDPSNTYPVVYLGGVSPFFKLHFKDQENPRFENFSEFGIGPLSKQGYPANLTVVYTFAEIQRQRERGIPEDELVPERTFGFWIDRNAFDMEDYEKVLQAVNERAGVL